MLFGCDLGSSSAKALRLDRRGRAAHLERRRIATRRLAGGRVEHDAEEILAAALGALRAAAGRTGQRGRDAALGIATQRSTVVFWDRDSGRPLTPAYSWQDRRGAALCSRLGASRGAAGAFPRDQAAAVAARTGLFLSPHYSASKIAWALRHVPALRRRVAAGTALWGTLGTFVLWRMTEGAVYAVDHANAQRTLLFDVRRLAWDPDLFALFGLQALLDAPALPAIVPTYLSAEIAATAGAGTRLRPAALTGDQQAALIGLACRRAGDVAINYGSGAFVLRNVGREPCRREGLLTTLLASWSAAAPHALPGTGCEARFAVEGPVNAALIALDWARRRLRLDVRVSGIDDFLGAEAGRPRRVHFLPAIAGLGAPRWDPQATPRFAGDVRGATPRDLLRAVVESIALRCTEVLRAASPAPARRGAGGTEGEAPVRVSGGLVRCRTLLQAQADLLQRPILVVASPDATALGAAVMADEALRRAGAAGRTRPEHLKHRGSEEAHGGGPGGRLVRPRISRSEAEARYRAWERAVYGGPSPRAAR